MLVEASMLILLSWTQLFMLRHCSASIYVKCCQGGMHRGYDLGCSELPIAWMQALRMVLHVQQAECNIAGHLHHTLMLWLDKADCVHAEVAGGAAVARGRGSGSWRRLAPSLSCLPTSLGSQHCCWPAYAAAHECSSGESSYPDFCSLLQMCFLREL